MTIFRLNNKHFGRKVSTKFGDLEPGVNYDLDETDETVQKLVKGNILYRINEVAPEPEKPKKKKKKKKEGDN